LAVIFLWINTVRMNSNARLVATGIREPGCTEFRLTIYGNAGRELPPAVLIASLTEFRSWIGQMQGSCDTTVSSGGASPRP
jgi:hypothetical protein